MRIVRPIFLVPLANDRHGKSTIIKALVAQGIGRAFQVQRKGQRGLVSPTGRNVDAYVFGRSYQEKEKGEHGSVAAALDANDPLWRTRELIVMPSHVSGVKAKGLPDDLDQMIDAAHSAGFDIVCAAVLFDSGHEQLPPTLPGIWRKTWDARWRLPNPFIPSPDGQLNALGCDLWGWTCRALTGG